MDWIQVLFAGIGGGAGCYAAITAKKLINKREKKIHRIIFSVIVVIMSLVMGVISIIVFDNNAITAFFRAYWLPAIIIIILPFSASESTTDLEDDTSDMLKTLKIQLKDVYGCFKADIDPRTMQPSERNLYYFAEGVLWLNDTHLIFSHLREDSRKHVGTLHIKKEIKCIENIIWHYYDKNQHEDEQKIRYLVPGVFRLWKEVGYFWLPGGLSTEIECVISCNDKTEYYFYFIGSDKNLNNIYNIRDIVTHERLSS